MLTAFPDPAEAVMPITGCGSTSASENVNDAVTTLGGMRTVVGGNETPSKVIVTTVLVTLRPFSVIVPVTVLNGVMGFGETAIDATPVVTAVAGVDGGGAAGAPVGVCATTVSVVCTRCSPSEA